MGRDATDGPSFAAAYAAHRDRAVGLAYLLVGDRDQAEDVVADAFAKVYVRWRRGEVRDLGAYVRRAVANEARSKLRRRYLERAVAARRTGDDRGVRLVDEAAADRDQLWQALARLPRTQRTVLVLRYFEDLSEAETADLLGCSLGAVKSRASRGVERLEQLVGDTDLTRGRPSSGTPARRPARAPTPPPNAGGRDR